MTARGEMICLMASVVFLAIVVLVSFFGIIKAIYEAIQEHRYGKGLYAVAAYYHGEAEFLQTFSIVAGRDEAIFLAKDLLWNTVDYKSIVYAWDNKKDRIEEIVWEGNTFAKKVEVNDESAI